MKKIYIICLLFLTACEKNAENNLNEAVLNKSSIEHAIMNRWYKQSQLTLGEKVYRKNCMQCHNENAKGTQAWKQLSPDGNYPPPPLNGSAHAWHHDLGTLTRSIKNGGVPLGGVMPAFKDKLSEQEIRAVIAYFQSFWSDEVYSSWLENGGLE
ncbi:Cytochrome c family protein [hydrothermal vent metagenome]|uniref:Cytochrome c family protein n=1 Tax=hydrothermal vent metagenome TaxID=652676 RepID=A0A3B0XPR8_9ZZZZ